MLISFRKSLQELIATRPEESLEIKKLIEEINKELDQEEININEELAKNPELGEIFQLKL